MAIKNSVSNDFLSTLVDSIHVFDCRLPGVITGAYPYRHFKLNSQHPHSTQVNRMSRSRRVLAIGGKHCEYGWTGSVFIHFYFL